MVPFGIPQHYCLALVLLLALFTIGNNGILGLAPTVTVTSGAALKPTKYPGTHLVFFNTIDRRWPSSMVGALICKSVIGSRVDSRFSAHSSLDSTPALSAISANCEHSQYASSSPTYESKVICPPLNGLSVPRSRNAQIFPVKINPPGAVNRRNFTAERLLPELPRGCYKKCEVPLFAIANFICDLGSANRRAIGIHRCRANDQRPLLLLGAVRHADGLRLGCECGRRQTETGGSQAALWPSGRGDG